MAEKVKEIYALCYYKLVSVLFLLTQGARTIDKTVGYNYIKRFVIYYML